MKEKIREILTIKRGVVYGDFPGLIADLEHLVNQEAEKRIAERMSSEEDFQNAESRYEDEQNEDKLRFDTEYCYRDYMNGWEDCRSRLSQKTEGGGE